MFCYEHCPSAQVPSKHALLVPFQVWRRIAARCPLRATRSSSHQEIMFRVRCFPALVKPERLLAQIVALRIQTFAAHANSNGPQFVIQIVDVRLQFLQMHFAVLIDHTALDEHTVHVAFQCRILVNFAVGKLFDCLCGK